MYIDCYLSIRGGGNSWVYKICYQGWNSGTLVTQPNVPNVPNVQGGKRNKITHCSMKAPTIGSHIVYMSTSYFFTNFYFTIFEDYLMMKLALG
jgi:hypothetical protein